MTSTALPFPARTRHFVERACHRGLRPEVLDFILAYGIEFRAAGATSLTVLERRLPAAIADAPVVRRARGWIVVTTDDGVLLTCYRRGDASRFLRTKPKRSEPLAGQYGRDAA
jgi:hypothetical protein